MTNETDKDFILEGAAGMYRRIDLNQASMDVSSLKSFDSDLDSLGFTLTGDLMCSALVGFLRCYANPREHACALLLVGIKDGMLSVFGLMFEAKFSDGSTLTTTTSPAMRDMPEKGIHRRVYAWAGVYDLYRKHQSHANELKDKHGDLQPIGETLLAVAESIDSATDTER